MNDSFFETHFPNEFESRECTLFEIYSLSGSELPEKETFFTIFPDEYKPFLFEDVIIHKNNETIKFGFLHLREGNLWIDSKWSYNTFSRILVNQASASGITCHLDEAPEDINAPSSAYQMGFLFSANAPEIDSLGKKIDELVEILRRVIRDTEILLEGGIIWNEAFEKNERIFTLDVLLPLFRKMDFLSVRYNHGTTEFGKDITFSELTKFGILRHYAVQAKAGDLSGKVNSDVDEILGQLEDAFTMPYYKLGSKEARFISMFIIAISGHFTNNAKRKNA